MNEQTEHNGAELELPQQRSENGAEISDAHLDAVIVSTEYSGDTERMVCTLTVRNGATIGGVYVRGEDTLDEANAKQAALAQARQMLRVLESYCLVEAQAQQAEIQKLIAAAQVETLRAGEDLKATVPELIAPVAYEVNRAYCLAIGDGNPEPWGSAPEWQRSTVIHGVQFHLNNPDATPESSHQNWLGQKMKEGWVYGKVKDAENKTHPCIVPYADLPTEQRAKDYIFRAIVHTMVKPYLGRNLH